MDILEIIAKKRDGKTLSYDEIFYFIDNYVKGEILDYQASALLMAIYLRGMSDEETFFFTEAMVKTSDLLDLSTVPGAKVDKHSTGGVGDKTSLILGPIVASCGAKVAKMSGRGLGHTGGTIDKLESIPGMNVALTEEQFKDILTKTNMSLMRQTGMLCPADAKLYALRDVTATVGVVPLIASSIMAKKIACGADTILLDVKMGSGAFMKTKEDAIKLANALVDIGKKFQRDTRALITNMEEPLGDAVGNILEVKEAIDVLHCKGPKDITELCLKAAGVMLTQAKISNNEDEGYEMAKKQLTSGAAFNKFKEWIAGQGGDVSYLDNPNLFPNAKYTIEVKSPTDGYIKIIDALTIGGTAMKLGAGRLKLDDIIDPTAGVILKKKVGDYVNKDDVLCVLYTNKILNANFPQVVLAAYEFSENPIAKNATIIEYIK